jgi:hypothetical protein
MGPARQWRWRSPTAGPCIARLPGELGRRLARDHVLGEVRDQAERQIGRARADLQQRLAEATRQLVLAAGRRYFGSTDRLARALRTAAVLREQTAGQAAGTLAELAGRPGAGAARRAGPAGTARRRWRRAG